MYELTIIVSNYNQEKHLPGTLDSVFAQEVSFPFKVIVTDDHSTKDHSKEVIERYAELHHNIEPVFADENGGYLTNILRAKAKTKTKYFCLLDADDYWTDKGFLQRAYDFLEQHDEYTIFESNVEVIEDGQAKGHPFISPHVNSGIYSKEMFLNNKPVPITQTTGMILRNAIFSKGIPEMMTEAVGTRSERSFEGDTGRFIMHLKEGLAYYDNRVVGVYRLTPEGIWNRLRTSEKKIIQARMFIDYYRYYGTNPDFFVNRSYRSLQEYLREKQKEAKDLTESEEFISEGERLMAEDVYRFCMKHDKEIIPEKGFMDKAKQIYRILRA